MRYVALLLILMSPLLAQHEGPQRPDVSPDPPAGQFFGNAEAIEQGRTLFVTVCSGCHGPNGEGGRGPNLIEGGNTRQASNRELFEWIQKGIPGTDMPPSALPDEQVWRLAAFVRNLSASAYDQRLPGDPVAGRELFFGRAGCMNCHAIRGQGGLLGPDLSDEGASRKQVQIREAIVDPNKRITDGFTPVVVKVKGGIEIAGVAKNYNNYSMQLLDKSGSLHLLPKAQLDSVVFRAKTWMPADYAQRLTAAEIDNLVSFLSRQVIRVPAAEERDEQGRPRRRSEDN
jgi:putative heme-binding domain-containing protein